jgi:hypothetical protein
MVSSLLGGESLEEASTWADDIRQSRPETARWHYVNIPLAAQGYNPERDCRRGCVVGQILREEAIITDRGIPASQRAEALKFLVHFIGDVHQPLHCSDNGDHGGSLLEVRFLGKTTTLHQLWDSRLLDRARLPNAAALEAIFAKEDLRSWSEGDLVSWVNESHRLAPRAYRIPPSRTLGRAYVDANVPIVEEQIMKAGLRLAATLNRIATGPRP